LTQAGHFGDHDGNQRRFAPALPHITGIGAPLQRNTQRLRAAGSSLSSPAAWQALETVRCVTVEVGSRTKLCVTRGSRQAAEVLKILRLAELDPPQPPEGKETAM